MDGVCHMRLELRLRKCCLPSPNVKAGKTTMCVINRKDVFSGDH